MDCYTDFVGLHWSPDMYMDRMLNNNNATADTLYFATGDELSIQINGSDAFKAAARAILEERLFPYVNLWFRFEPNNGNILIDDKWTYGGATTACGSQYPTIHISEPSPFLVLHMTLHALGMHHEYREPATQLAYVEPYLKECLRTNDTGDRHQPFVDRQEAIPDATPSIMALPPRDGELAELSEFDKAWLRHAYGPVS